MHVYDFLAYCQGIPAKDNFAYMGHRSITIGCLLILYTAYRVPPVLAAIVCTWIQVAAIEVQNVGKVGRTVGGRRPVEASAATTACRRTVPVAGIDEDTT